MDERRTAGLTWVASRSPEVPIPNVLVVDDDPAIRRLILRILEGAGYQVAEAGSGEQARACLRVEAFDAVLIDARMPGESGVDLLRHIRTHHPDAAPVMVTAQEDHDLIESAFGAGAYGFVVKPFRSRELLINLTNALHRRELEMSNRSHIRQLEETVRERTRLLQEALAPLPDPDLIAVSAEEVIGELSRAVTVRDEETGLHILRMSNYAPCCRSGRAWPARTPSGSAWPRPCTTWARSASRTRCCSSPDRSPRRSTGSCRPTPPSATTCSAGRSRP